MSLEEDNTSEPLRDINSILFFRNDISPFLVHLTKNIDSDHLAKTNLENILDSKQLSYGENAFSDSRFGFDFSRLNTEIKRKYFSAVSFTETPLGEIHNLLEIRDRQVNLEPYGLVFRKDFLKDKGVSPVLYLNNVNGDKDVLVRALCEFIDNKPEVAEKILPYVSVFGKNLEPLGGTAVPGEIDFSWEREWRYTSHELSFQFEPRDIFIGLCPHEEISYFENRFDTEFMLQGNDDYFYPLQFVDPRRNTKWYAEKLISARHRSSVSYSVV